MHITTRSFMLFSLEKNMVRACIEVFNTYASGPAHLVNWFACDPWAVPHMVVPFMIGVWTRNAWFAFCMAGIGELLEYSVLTFMKSFVIFLGTHSGRDLNHDIENLAGSYVDDWLIQGGAGALLSWVFYRTFLYPALVTKGDFWYRHLWFLFYSFILFIINIVVPAALFLVEVGSFKLGLNLPYIIHITSAIFILLVQPRGKWAGYSAYQQLEFWFHWLLFSVVLNAQNNADWFFSSAVQSWFVGGLFLLMWIAIWAYRSWPWESMTLNFNSMRWNYSKKELAEREQ